MLKSAKLTGIWENKLRKIERKEYEASMFISELKELIVQIVNDVLTDNSGNRIVVEEDKKETSKPKKETTAKRRPPIRDLSQIPCPVCGKGTVIKGNTAYGCSEFRSGCQFRVSFDEIAGDLKPSEVNKKLQQKYKK